MRSVLEFGKVMERTYKDLSVLQLFVDFGVISVGSKCLFCIYEKWRLAFDGALEVVAAFDITRISTHDDVDYCTVGTRRSAGLK
jgi:hypothetical protein